MKASFVSQRDFEKNSPHIIPSGLAPDNASDFVKHLTRTTAKRRVFTYLYKSQKKYGSIRASLDWIACNAGICTRTVERVIGELISDGVLIKQTNYKSPNFYKLSSCLYKPAIKKHIYLLFGIFFITPLLLMAQLHPEQMEKISNQKSFRQENVEEKDIYYSQYIYYKQQAYKPPPKKQKKPEEVLEYLNKITKHKQSVSSNFVAVLEEYGGTLKQYSELIAFDATIVQQGLHRIAKVKKVGNYFALLITICKRIKAEQKEKLAPTPQNAAALSVRSAVEEADMQKLNEMDPLERQKLNDENRKKFGELAKSLGFLC